MGKRSNFDRIDKDNYPTIDPRAVGPLVSHLPPRAKYAEPCAGAGDLINLLQPHARCVRASDIQPRADGIAENDALTCGLGAADMFITNPPWSRAILHPLIIHLSDLAPTWLLFDSAWANTKQARPFMARCRKIVAVGRLRWIPGTKHQGKDDVSWFLFDRPIPGSAPVFYGQGCAPPELPSKASRVCFDCGRIIGKTDKWAIVQRGGVMTTAHRHCDNPGSYYARGAAPIAPAPLLDFADRAGEAA